MRRSTRKTTSFSPDDLYDSSDGEDPDWIESEIVEHPIFEKPEKKKRVQSTIDFPCEGKKKKRRLRTLKQKEIDIAAAKLKKKRQLEELLGPGASQPASGPPESIDEHKESDEYAVLYPDIEYFPPGVLNDDDIKLMRSWMTNEIDAKDPGKHVKWESDEQSTVSMFGKKCRIPRDQSGYHQNDRPRDYKFSSMTLTGKPYSDLTGLDAIRTKVQRHCTLRATSTPMIGFDLNFAVFNLYQDGTKSIGHHQDDEGNT